MNTATTHIDNKPSLLGTKQSHPLSPALRFKEFDGEWCKDKIGNITNVTSGGTPSTLKPEYWGGDIRWMNSGDLNLKRVFEVKNRITEKGLEKSSTKIIPVNSILIGLAGQGKTRGTAAMNIVELCINQSIAAILPAENFDSEFLYQNIDGRYEELRRLSTGDGGRGGLNLQIIKGFYVPVPTLPEQEKIASFLSAVDEKIQQLTKKKALLEQYKKGVMQQLFPSTGSGQRSGQLRFKDENGKAYPDWEEKRLGEIVSISSGISPASYELKEEGSIPFLKVEELNNCSKYQLISRFYAEQGRNIVPKGSVVFPKRGAAILNNKVRITAVDAFMDSNLMALQVDKDSDNEFLYYFLIKKQLFKIADTSTIPQINNKHIEPYPIRLPLLPEQQKIARYLSGIDTKIESVTNQITQTQTFKKGLLQQLFV